MITIMKTKTFLNALDDAYAKGVAAGSQAEALKNREDQNRRLDDMLQHGKRLGHQTGFEEGYRRGYTEGYMEGELDAKSAIQEIDLDDVDPSVFEEHEDETVESV